MLVKSASVKTETRGSLKTGTIQIKANNKGQFDIISTLYLRIGYTMLLEYGWSIYFDEDNKLKAADALTEPFKNFFNSAQVFTCVSQSSPITSLIIITLVFLLFLLVIVLSVYILGISFLQKAHLC